MNLVNPVAVVVVAAVVVQLPVGLFVVVAVAVVAVADDQKQCPGSKAAKQRQQRN